MIASASAGQLEIARDGGSPERLAELEAKVAGAVRRSRAESTIASYQSDMRDFAAFCRGLGVAPVPASPATVAAYLAELADPPDDRVPLAASTINRRRAAISEAHKHAGAPNPCTDDLVRQVVKGIRRTIGVAPKNRKSGLSTADIRAIVTTTDTTRLIGVRDVALVLVGFATALRRSELVAITVDDVEDHADGMIVWRRRSKTDQEGVGHRIEVAYGDQAATCPVRWYRSWIDAARIASGPVFRAVDRHGNVGDRALSDRAVARITKIHARRLGHDPALFAGHSLRRGFSTEASRNGAAERTIAATTGHTSTKGLQPYIEDAEVFTDPPSRYLGL